MNNQNIVSFQLSAAALSDINDFVSGIRQHMDFLIRLTQEERKEQLKMGDASLPFVLKVRDYVSANPQNVPGYMDVPEFLKDVQGHEDLTKIVGPILDLASDINDTLMMVGSEAYIEALSYYSYMKHGAKIGAPGAKTTYEDLKERFKPKAKKSSGQGDEQ